MFVPCSFRHVCLAPKKGSGRGAASLQKKRNVNDRYSYT